MRHIWFDSEGFNRYRGTGWMKGACVTCPDKEKDLGGCRCQAFLLARRSGGNRSGLPEERAPRCGAGGGGGGRCGRGAGASTTAGVSGSAGLAGAGLTGAVARPGLECVSPVAGSPCCAARARNPERLMWCSCAQASTCLTRLTGKLAFKRIARPSMRLRSISTNSHASPWYREFLGSTSRLGVGTYDNMPKLYFCNFYKIRNR